MSRFVVGDIHGYHIGLQQVLERSKFDRDKDKLVVLGDVCDGYPSVDKCFDELLTIKNLVYVMGNHDSWALEWYADDLRTPASQPDTLWTRQGGQATLDSYGEEGMKAEHIHLLEHNSCIYHVDGNKLFVHGGIDELVPLEEQTRDTCLWDRSMLNKAVMVHHINPDYKFQEWETIYIGHTTTMSITRDTEPLRVCNVMNLDTGAGWRGKVTIMDYDSGEYWQSEPSGEVHANHQPRRNA